MQAYSTEPAASKPAASFELTPFRPRVRKVLDEWVSRALAQIKPWRWELRARIARTWDRNPNHQTGAHSKERMEREAQLRGDLRWFRAPRTAQLAGRLPWSYRKRYSAVVHQVERLTAGAWWEERTLVDRRTGEAKPTTYLPEDTWSAQAALHWCVEFLARLTGAFAGAMTDNTTPRSKPREAVNSFRGGRTASRGWDARAAFAGLAEKYGGAQPELPATS